MMTASEAEALSNIVKSISYLEMAKGNAIGLLEDPDYCDFGIEWDKDVNHKIDKMVDCVGAEFIVQKMLYATQEMSAKETETWIKQIFGYKCQWHDADLRRFLDVVVKDESLLDNPWKILNDPRGSRDKMSSFEMINDDIVGMVYRDAQYIIMYLLAFRDALYAVCDAKQIYNMRSKFETYLDALYPAEPHHTANILFRSEVTPPEPEQPIEPENVKYEMTHEVRYAILTVLLKWAGCKESAKCPATAMNKFCANLFQAGDKTEHFRKNIIPKFRRHEEDKALYDQAIEWLVKTGIQLPENYRDKLP